MNDLRKATQDVLNRYDEDDGVIDAHTDFDLMEALREALQAEPEFNPASLFKTADGHMSIDGYCVSFKEGNVVGVSAMTTPPSVDALIAELMDLSLTYPDYTDVKNVCDKYRSKP